MLAGSKPISSFLLYSFTLRIEQSKFYTQTQYTHSLVVGSTAADNQPCLHLIRRGRAMRP